MRIEFVGRHLEITPSLKEFTQKKINKIIKYLDDTAEAHVTLSIEKHRQIAEVIIKTKLLTLSGSEETDDMYASIGLAINKIEKQAKRLRQKIWGRKRKLRNKKQHSLNEWSIPASEQNPDSIGLRIIKSSNFILKPMTVEEAAIQIGMTNEHVIVFQNSESHKINVLYERKDGNLGLIEPQFD